MDWRFWLTDRSRYAPHQTSIEAVFDMLDDQSSRTQFAAALGFRLGRNPSHAPQPDADPQYFPTFMTAGVAKPVSMVDGGAYDGDTLREAARHLPLAAAVAFEPEPENFRRLADAVRPLPFPVICIACGLSNETRQLRYATGQGEASTVCDDGAGSVQVVRLDDCLPNMKIDYLKLDVEGHELAALAGAELCLRRDRPRLAVAGYHRWDDLWRIPQFILQLDLGYRIGFRIHAHNTFDCVFYAY
jgi:FkbM family methyltransferase